jgi:Arc/MetJ family transcription regulator
MRAIINIDDNLLKKASELSGISEKTSLVKAGLEALIVIESGKRLATLGGTEKSIKSVPRRRKRNSSR